MAYKLIISDFDGVVCKDYYYSNLRQLDTDLFEFINQKLFRENPEMVNEWMRGTYSYHDINKWLKKENPQISFDLDEILLESIDDMAVDEDYLNEMQLLRGKGKKVVIVTNNMDIFELKMIEKKGLNEFFDEIFCSSSFGSLKHEQEGKFFRFVLDKYGITKPQECLLIDDSVKATNSFSTIGGDYYLYKNFQGFMEFISHIN